MSSDSSGYLNFRFAAAVSTDLMARIPKQQKFHCHSHINFQFLNNMQLNILSCVGYVTRPITSRCQGCSDYLLHIHFYTYTILHITITLNLIQPNVSISVQLYLGQCWTSTVFGGDYPKTVLRMQSPLIYAAVATQWTFCYNRGYSC
jgi:hypothetical protein